MDPEILKTLVNKNRGKSFFCEHNSDELTSLCPSTRLPDFYSFKVIYEPEEKLIELKSLKYYLNDFRNDELYHEELANQIFDDLKRIIEPKWIFVCLKAKVRGGIDTTVKRYWKRI
ncbi:MAG: preQ(1) synthase [Methanoregula sp.]|nr:preQ(1) synthase [Methanoregula sp.]